MSSSYTGTRECPISATRRGTSAGGVDTSMPWMLGRGTMTSRTVVSANSNTLWTSSSSARSKTPWAAPSRTR